MPIVLACIIPHGGEVVPELSPRREASKFMATRIAVQKLARIVKSVSPQVLIIATPHNLRLWGHIAVCVAENSSGTLKEGSRVIELSVKCDVEFALRLFEKSRERGIPVVGANFGTTNGPLSNMPMDWGTMVPLWFLVKKNHIRPRVVIVSPSREIPLEQNAQFGEVIAEVSREDKSRIVFVASADQAHTHKIEGPYGFNEKAREYDSTVLRAISRDRMEEELVDGIDMKLVDEAKADSLWQMVVLTGLLRRIKLEPRVYSYDVPTYYGMLAAAFRAPKQSATSRNGAPRARR